MLAALNNWERVFNLIAAIFLLVIILVVSALFASQAGQQLAIQQQKNFQGCYQAANKIAGCIYVRDNNAQIASGVAVARSSSHLALYANGKTTTYPLKDCIIESYPKKSDENNQPKS